MKKIDSTERDRALAIEYWIAAIFVGGSFLAGLLHALRYLLP